MQIKEISIDHYGPLRDRKLQLQPGFQVIKGPNESGKTLFIDAVLKLMLGNRLREFENIDRVDSPPRGRVVLLHRGREHILDGAVRLSQVVDLDSQHLRNIFVIRNKDLNLTQQGAFLQRVNDQLTGMETQRLLSLRTILSKLGRLTNPTSTAKLSNSAEHGKIADQVDKARSLAAQISDYIHWARDQGLDSLERRQQDLRQSLTQVDSQIKLQEQAQERHSYLTKAELVREYQDRQRQLNDLKPYTRQAREELQQLVVKIENANNRQQQLREELTRKQQDLGNIEERLRAIKARLATVPDQRQRLEALKEQVLVAASSPTPVTGKFLICLTFSLIAVAGLSLGLAAGGLLSPALLWLVLPVTLAGALAFAGLHMRARNLANSVHHRRQLLLDRGAAVGIMAQSLLELSAALTQEIATLEEQRTHLVLLEEEAKRGQRDMQALENSLATAKAENSRWQRELTRRLEELAVGSLAELEAKVGQQIEVNTLCSQLQSQLCQVFAVDLPPTAGWQDLLDKIPPPPDPGITFDRSLLTQLRDQREQLARELDNVREEINEHHNKLREFTSQCLALPLAEEIDVQLPTQFDNLDMLEYAAELLEQFCQAVEAKFTAALAAVKILETIEEEERARLGDLLAPDKPVAEIFRAITEGRYEQVKLDSHSQIQVTRRDGAVLPVAHLSQGTYDQLYLALRISLGQELLANEPGFFIMDDAFLCADSHRTEAMLARMADLANRGWQILYFTSDDYLVQAAAGHTANPILTLQPLPI